MFVGFGVFYGFLVDDVHGMSVAGLFAGDCFGDDVIFFENLGLSFRFYIRFHFSCYFL